MGSQSVESDEFGRPEHDAHVMQSELYDRTPTLARRVGARLVLVSPNHRASSQAALAA